MKVACRVKLEKNERFSRPQQMVIFVFGKLHFVPPKCLRNWFNFWACTKTISPGRKMFFFVKKSCLLKYLCYEC